MAPNPSSFPILDRPILNSRLYVTDACCLTFHVTPVHQNQYLIVFLKRYLLIVPLLLFFFSPFPFYTHSFSFLVPPIRYQSSPILNLTPEPPWKQESFFTLARGPSCKPDRSTFSLAVIYSPERSTSSLVAPSVSQTTPQPLYSVAVIFNASISVIYNPEHGAFSL